MKFIIIIFMLISSILQCQDRLTFLKDITIKENIQKSIDFLEKSPMIPQNIKNNKIIFITIDFDDIFGQEIEGYGINYSTYIPTQYSKLNTKGQFETNEKFGITFFNYSKLITLVFFKGARYLDQNQMKRLSNEVGIDKNNLMNLEFFKYQKGNNLMVDAVENLIYFKKNGKVFEPVKINSFDLSTFMKIWLHIDAEEIPISESSAQTNKISN